MNLLIRYTYVVALCLVTSISFSQGKIEFEKSTHDFGIVEEGELPTYVFVFKNVGNEPLELTTVKPSCGCTSPYWKKGAIAPGDTGSIKVTYKTQGRPGSFNKAVNIVSNAENPHTIIYIKGIVNRKTEKPVYTKEELANSPTFSINKTVHTFGKIEKNKTQTYRFVVTNTGKEPLKIKNVQAGCKCVHFTVSKPEIAEGETATLELSYVPKSSGDLVEKVSIATNDRNNSYTTITLKAKVVDRLTERNMMQEGGVFGF